MTERLYYTDCFLREFDARVLGVEIGREGGARVRLDRTAFYPTSGGQPHDRGTLEGIPVEEVCEDAEGEILHVLVQPPANTKVRGKIDWPRRFDHMQQHTGQHVLSAAFVRLLNLPTVSFHLGEEICTIDLPTGSLGQRQLRAVEELANQVVFEDRAVHIRFAEPRQIENKGTRRAADREGELRLVEIEDFDRCSCGGTHVTRTGQVGLVLLRGVEKMKQQVRVEFVCGHRALATARADHQHLEEAARLLTTGTAQLPDVLRKKIEERRAAEKARARLLERLAELEAQALLVQAENLGYCRLIVGVLAETDANYLRQLASRLVREPGVQVLLANQDQPAAVVFAQSTGLSTDMSALLRETLAKAGGKGGGNRDFAQGSVPDSARLPEALAEAKRALRASAPGS